MKFPVVISTNCSGANFYHNYLNLQFYSPFIWSVVSYNDISKLIDNWNKFDWFNYKIIPNKTRELTYTLIIDDLINVNYVHYFYSDKYNEFYTKGASVFSKNIIKFIENKYTERTNRMLKYGDIENPYFIIHEEEYSNENNSSGFEDIYKKKSKFKKVLISHSYDFNKKIKNTFFIKSDQKMLPQNMIEKYGDGINSFFNISSDIKTINKNILNNTTDHQ